MEYVKKEELIIGEIYVFDNKFIKFKFNFNNTSKLSILN